MPSELPKTILRFPSLNAKESIEVQAAKAGLSLNNYILRELGLETLQHGGAHNPHGRKGKPVKKGKT